MTPPLHVTHVITGLEVGGAELFLAGLLAAVDREAVTSDVVSLTGEGRAAEQLRAAGIEVRSLGSCGFTGPAALARLTAQVRRRRPDVVQTWLYAADLVGGVAARLAGQRAVAWNLRQASLDPQRSRRRHVATARLCGRLSRRVPAAIVCGSEAAVACHVAVGYDRERMVVVSNGFDGSRFRPDPDAGPSVRAELGLPGDALLVGCVGRLDPFKEHGDALAAFARVRVDHPGAHLVLCGHGVDQNAAVVRKGIAANGLDGFVHALGVRADVPRLVAAFDVAVSASSSEGFPNAVGEAMAAGVPVAVTDAGDSALLVGDTATVVAPHDVDGLAAATSALLALPPAERSARGAACRDRVLSQFSLAAAARRYERVWADVAAGRRPR